MMNLIVSMLFLTAVVCQTTAQAQNYNQLEPRVKKFVDLAIIRANQKLNYNHLNFYTIGKDHNEVSSQVRIDVRLRRTTCRKAPGANEHRHRPECKFLKLEVHCMVCSKDPNTSDPYIDCVRKKDINRTHHETWNEHCATRSGPGVRRPGEDNPLSGGAPTHSGPGGGHPGGHNLLTSSWDPGSDVVENDNPTATSLNVTADQGNVTQMNASDYDYEEYVFNNDGVDDSDDAMFYY